MKNVKKDKSKISKKVSLAVMGLAALGIVGVSGLGVSALSSSDNSQDSLASRLATKFGLNKDDVAKELDAYHQEERANHEAEMKTRLSDALQKKVDDGTITAEQKTAIENKLEERHKAHEAEMEANKKSNTKPTKEEMDAKRTADKTEMDAWLKEQGINLDLKDVLPSRDRGSLHKSEGGE